MGAVHGAGVVRQHGGGADLHGGDGDHKWSELARRLHADGESRDVGDRLVRRRRRQRLGTLFFFGEGETRMQMWGRSLLQR